MCNRRDKYCLVPEKRQKTPGRKTFRVIIVSEIDNYRYLAVLTLTPGPMVEATVQERIY